MIFKAKQYRNRQLFGIIEKDIEENYTVFVVSGRNLNFSEKFCSVTTLKENPIFNKPTYK